MIWIYLVLMGFFMFGIGWFTRGYSDADTIDRIEADLAAARRAARQRDMDLRTPVSGRPYTKESP